MSQITVGMVVQALRCHEQQARGLLQEVDKNIDRYANRALEVMGDRDIYNLMSELGRERARGRFDAVRMAQEYGTLYEEMKDRKA